MCLGAKQSSVFKIKMQEVEMFDAYGLSKSESNAITQLMIQPHAQSPDTFSSPIPNYSSTSGVSKLRPAGKLRTMIHC